MKSRTIFFFALSVFSLIALTANPQDILTPVDYFVRVSERFETIKDYQAEIRIAMEEDEIEWSGSILYKKPNRLRIDYVEPAEQVLVYDGKTLIFYRPEYSTVFEQVVEPGDATDILPGSGGLTLLSDNYSVAYLIGPEPVPLDEDGEESVVKLKFRANSTAEGFRELEIAFGEDGFYRRVTGRTLNRTWTIDFTNVVINPGIPDPRFDYKYPANANVYNDFLFEAKD